MPAGTPALRKPIEFVSLGAPRTITAFAEFRDRKMPAGTPALPTPRRIEIVRLGIIPTSSWRIVGGV